MNPSGSEGVSPFAAKLMQDIDDALSLFKTAFGTTEPTNEHMHGASMEKHAACHAAGRACIERVTQSDSSYRKQIPSTYDPKHGQLNWPHTYIIASILHSIRRDVAAGRLDTLSESIRGDLFTDFLEMSDYLLGQGLKDPAAVIAGAVLEGHLRKLCEKGHILTRGDDGSPLKADRLNAELAKTEAISKTDQKSITGWLGLRNDAAHGHFDRYESGQVRLQIAGIRDFVVRHPA